MHTLNKLIEIYNETFEKEPVYFRKRTSVMLTRLKRLRLIEEDPTSPGWFRIIEEGIDFLEEIETELKLKGKVGKKNYESN